MKKVKEFIDKLTDYIDLGIFYLGYILFIAGFYLNIKMINFITSLINNSGIGGWDLSRIEGNLALSIVGVYFIRSYKKKDK